VKLGLSLHSLWPSSLTASPLIFTCSGPEQRLALRAWSKIRSAQTQASLPLNPKNARPDKELSMLKNHSTLVGIQSSGHPIPSREWLNVCEGRDGAAQCFPASLTSDAFVSPALRAGTSQALGPCLLLITPSSRYVSATSRKIGCTCTGATSSSTWFQQKIISKA
jgi:hypothetical protein